MLTGYTVREYAARLAAGEPTPGGGSAAALCGALGAALGEMAANFTVGREKFAAVESDVQAILGRLESHRLALLDLTDADADAYAQVGAAYSMPRDTDEQKAARTAAIQDALKAAAQVPLAATEACARVIADLDELRQKANPNLLSDVAVSAEFALAALRCAMLNVDVNLASIKDSGWVAEKRETIDRLLAESEPVARSVFDAIAAGLRQS
ncbi:MAG: cyclodeaminase/cyclohydrolase family protein [Acidobacteriota bacterium]|nr:cyclodeaminase/cyclohydrolase family protein [Acidobacteriota bacterium]